MSHTYDELDAHFEKTRREGGAKGISHHDDEDHPQQDMGDGYYSKPNLSQYADPEENSRIGGCKE